MIHMMQAHTLRNKYNLVKDLNLLMTGTLFTCFTVEANSMHRIAAELKKTAKEVPIIIRKPHASTFYQDVVKDKSVMGIVTSRACSYNCVYCHRIFGMGFRARSPENILLEMKTLYSEYGIREFFVWDNIFNL